MFQCSMTTCKYVWLRNEDYMIEAIKKVKELGTSPCGERQSV